MTLLSAVRSLFQGKPARETAEGLRARLFELRGTLEEAELELGVAQSSAIEANASRILAGESVQLSKAVETLQAKTAALRAAILAIENQAAETEEFARDDQVADLHARLLEISREIDSRSQRSAALKAVAAELDLLGPLHEQVRAIIGSLRELACDPTALDSASVEATYPFDGRLSPTLLDSVREFTDTVPLVPTPSRVPDANILGLREEDARARRYGIDKAREDAGNLQHQARVAAQEKAIVDRFNAALADIDPKSPNYNQVVEIAKSARLIAREDLRIALLAKVQKMIDSGIKASPWTNAGLARLAAESVPLSSIVGGG